MTARQRLLGFCAAILVLLPTSIATADIPPDPGYEEDCTIAKVQEADEYCEAHSASFQDVWGCTGDEANTPSDPEACSQNTNESQQACCNGWLAAGWTYRCSTAGASVFDTIWCRARVEDDPAAPDPAVEEENGGGDGCTHVGQATSGGLSALCGLILLCLGFYLKKRS